MYIVAHRFFFILRVYIIM